MLRTLHRSCLWVALLACACDDVAYGNGERATEARTLADFTRVESAGSVDVSIERGEAFEVVVSIDSNLLAELSTLVVDGTLVIRSDKDFEDIVAGPHVRVTLPGLRAATLSGSGEVRVATPGSGEPVTLNLSGSGRMLFDGTAPETTVHLSGSGDVDLVGESDRVALILDGSGDIDASALRASEGRLKLDGSGSIRANVEGAARVDLSGSGDIYLYGAPQLTSLSIDGSGELHTD